jgi:hypothetical protein
MSIGTTIITGRYRVKPGCSVFICTEPEQTPEGIWTANEQFLTEGEDLEILRAVVDEGEHYYVAAYNGYEDYILEEEELQYLQNTNNK